MNKICNSFSISLCFANGDDVSEYFKVKNEGNASFSDRIIQEIDVKSFESIRSMIEEKIIVFDGDVILNYKDLKTKWNDYWNSVSDRDYSDLNSVILMTLDDLNHRINYTIIHIKSSFKVITGEEKQKFQAFRTGTGFVKVEQYLLENGKCVSGFIGPTLPHYLSYLLDNMPYADNNFQYIFRKKDYPRYEITSYIGTSSSVDVPETIGGIKVEKFSLGERRDITKISIPNSVEFDNRQMLECEGLYDDLGNLIVGGRLVRIKKITPTIRIPDGVQTIAETVLYWDENDKMHSHQNDDVIEELYLPEGLKRIESYAFKECRSLRTIHFPKSLEEIGRWAFEHCKSLTEIVLPESTKKIGRAAFESCRSLRVIKVPSTCQIDECAFERCSNSEIGSAIVNGIFFDAYSYDDVVIMPPEVWSISANSFDMPGAILDEVTITDNIKYISEDAFGVTGIRRFRVVDHLTGKPLFETKKFKSSYSSGITLDCSPEFKKVCDLICAGKFSANSALSKFGTVFSAKDKGK